MVIKPCPPSFNNQKGITLVELLLVLALLGLVLAGIYQFFFFTNRTYSNAESQSISIQEANLFIANIEKDIRSASQPNDATTAIRVLNNSGSQARKGQQLDIYRYNTSTGIYERISYKIDGTELLKGSATSESQVLTASPQYGTITEWQTIVTNINDYEDTEFLFVDASNDGTVTSERRLIKVNLKIFDPDTNRPLNFQTSCLSRSGRSTTSQIAAGDTSTITIVPVTGITLTDESGNEVESVNTNNQGQTIIVTAVVSPEDADRPTVSWSENISWVTLGETDTSSGEQQTITLTANTSSGYGGSGNTRTATITVTSADGNITKTLTITQSRKLVTGIIITDQYGGVIDSITTDRQAKTISVTAVVSPDDADNQTVSWSVQGGNTRWVSLLKNNTISGEQQTITVAAYSGNQNTRTATIRIQSTDGSNITKTLTITQNK